jgi:hypothetical protein
MERISKDGKRLFFLAGNWKEDDNYSQRKSTVDFTKTGSKGSNKINFYDLCNCHAMWRCLESIGWKQPFSEQGRAPDNLAKFILNSEVIDNYYRKKFPSLHADWEAGNPEAYSPMEIHDVLAYATNTWMVENIVVFKERASIQKEIIPEIVLTNRPLVVSGKFAGLNHIVSLVGIIYDASDKAALVDKNENSELLRVYAEGSFAGANHYESFSKIQAVRDAVTKTKETGKVIVYPSGVLFDDPYGKTPLPSNGLKAYASESSGNDVEGTYSDLVESLKELNNSEFKMAHFFKAEGVSVTS